MSRLEERLGVKESGNIDDETPKEEVSNTKKEGSRENEILSKLRGKKPRTPHKLYEKLGLIYWGIITGYPTFVDENYLDNGGAVERFYYFKIKKKDKTPFDFSKDDAILKDKNFLKENNPKRYDYHCDFFLSK